jgi:hypothetical protein
MYIQLSVPGAKIVIERRILTGTSENSNRCYQHTSCETRHYSALSSANTLSIAPHKLSSIYQNLVQKEFTDEYHSYSQLPPPFLPQPSQPRPAKIILTNFSANDTIFSLCKITELCPVAKFGP